MAFSYCHKCGEGQDAPTISEFAYSGLHCRTCGVKREVHDDWFAMAVADMRDALDERLKALEAMELRLQAVEAAVHPPVPRVKLRVPDRGAPLVTWFAIEDVAPRVGDLLMVTGESGYTLPFLCLARFMHRRGVKPTWVDEAEDDLSDRGWVPTHWAERINLPGGRQ